MNQAKCSKTVSYQTTKERLNWVDYAKGIGIFLVVIGHVIRGLVNSSVLEPSSLLTFVDHWIYAFHMPLFFFISGLFVQRSLNKPFKDFILGKLCTIAYPYFIWSSIQGIFQAIGYKYTNNPFSLLDIWKIFYEPLLQFWFLYTLFSIILVYGILYQLKLPPLFFFVFSIILYCCHVFNINFGLWGILYLFRSHAIYFALGSMISVIKLTSFFTDTKLYTLLLLVFGGYLIVGLSTQLHLTENTIDIPLIAIVGISASVLLAAVLAKLNVLKFVQIWGRLSLEIFVAHSIAASLFRILIQKYFGFSEPITHFIFATIIGIYTPVALNSVCSRLGFQYMFTFKLLNRKIN